MNDSIYTIPVSEVFEPKDGCPICRLRNTLEQRCIDYILGAAMMEPDIRIKTNEEGFCADHFKMMFQGKNKLSLALMLESHLDYIQKDIFAKKSLFDKSAKSNRVKELQHSCYVCNKIDWALDRMLETVVRFWEKDKDFRQLYQEQPVICLEHYSKLCETAQGKVSKKMIGEFYEVTASLTEKYLNELKEDVTHFTKMFDYRNAGENADWKNSRDSIQRAIWYLTSRKVD